MKTILENNDFNTRLETSDWRYSASIVGLIKYFDYQKSLGEEIKYNIDHDILEYNSEDITEERYLLFAEYYFEEDMHHRVLEQILNDDELTEEQKNAANKKIKANSIMKKIFKNFKVSNENKDEILKLINENRLDLIRETYRNGIKLYRNFINPNLLMSEKGKICRLTNYYIDIAKKGKSIAYNWNINTYDYEDEIEFDFIPFAFSQSREGFFINNNYSIRQLNNSNNLIKDSDNPRNVLFKDMKKNANLIDYDVEIVTKDRDNDYFKTLYIRKDALKILKQINEFNFKPARIELEKDYWIDLEKEVIDSVLNKLKVDRLIDKLLKNKKAYNYNISILIKINALIYGGDIMDKKMKSAYGSAKKVAEVIEENKVNSYKQKMISSIVFKDYERFCEILLQLSSYSGVVFDFAYDLFEDFEGNKNIAYTFVNALNKQNGGNK